MDSIKNKSYQMLLADKASFTVKFNDVTKQNDT